MNLPSGEIKVRCPYCVENSAFKLMRPHQDHFVCIACGHETDLKVSDFECGCLKCRELKISRGEFPARW